MALPGQPSGVSQTSFIFASVFVAYLVYITLRGDLGKWLGVFGFGAGGGAPAGSSAAAGVGASTPANGTANNYPGFSNAPVNYSNAPFSQNPSFDSLQAIDTGYGGGTPYIDTTSTF